MSLEVLETRQVLSSITGQVPPPMPDMVLRASETQSPWLIPGDANQDLKLDQTDLVQVLSAGKYLTGEGATWAEGDWDGGPGGAVGSPPQGNGRFDQFDVIAALQTGAYADGGLAALAPDAGVRGDDQTSIIYNPATGELMVDAPVGRELTSINIDSASGILGGGGNLFRATFGSSFGSRSFGEIAPLGLSDDFIRNDLTVVGSLAGGGDLGPVDLATSACRPIEGHSWATEIERFGSSEELEQYLQTRPERPNPFDPPLPILPPSGSFDGGNLGGSFDNDSWTGPPPEHSTTNTQVAGVDEADLVETDGDYLYIISDQTLVIADAWPHDEIRVLSRWPVDGPVLGQYLIGNRLAIVSQSDRVTVTVLDVSNRTAPALVQETTFDGTYVESRAIGDFVYVFSSAPFGLTGQESLALTQNRPGQILQRGLPHFSAFDAHGNLAESGLLSQPTDIYKPVVPSDADLLSVVVFDARSDRAGFKTSTSVPSMSSARFYASNHSIYLVNPSCSTRGESESSSVLKLDIADAGATVELTGFGDVPGRPLDSFSMDEYQNNLRIATVQGGGSNIQNRVHVLGQIGQELRVIGRTESMATGERIRSVRFMEETAYVVTFPDASPVRRFVDPLFTVDLSDPMSPTVIGELEIPGFSNYLHPVGDDYLIGLGRDADQRTGRAEQLQLSLFRVSDLAHPFQADRYEFDLPVWADSEAIEDHHAIAYYPEFHILTLPVTNPSAQVTVDGNDDGVAEIVEERPLTDLWVFHIDLPGEGDPGAGIEFLGRIEQTSEVRRSVRIEDYLYSISNHSVDVYPIIDPSDHVAHLYFGQEDAGVQVFGADLTDQEVRDAVEMPDRSPPQVTHLRVRDSAWGQEFIDYLDLRSDAPEPINILPFDRIDQIRVTFSEDVFGTPTMRLRGADVSQYTIAQQVYDPESRTSTWTLDEPMDADSLRLQLSGVVDRDGNRLDGNANGAAGGTFTYRFRALPGDLNADGYVDRDDVQLAGGADRAIGVSDPNYSASRDLDGNGTIDAYDQVAVQDRVGSRLPRLPARLIPGDVDGDGIFGQLDLVRVLQSAKYMTGQSARWVDGDWNSDGAFDQLDIVRALAHGFTPGRPTLDVAVDEAFAALDSP